MGIAQSKLTSQGQISVPAAIRRRLGIGPGSVLEWREDGDEVVVRRVGRYSSEDLHQALFATRPRRRTIRQLKAGLEADVRRRHARR